MIWLFVMIGDMVNRLTVYLMPDVFDVVISNVVRNLILIRFLGVHPTKAGGTCRNDIRFHIYVLIYLSTKY